MTPSVSKIPKAQGRKCPRPGSITLSWTSCVKNESLKHLFAGMIAGMGEWAFGHPFDTLAVRAIRNGANILEPKTMASVSRMPRPGMGSVIFGVSGARESLLPRKYWVHRAATKAATARNDLVALYAGSIGELISLSLGGALLFGVKKGLDALFQVGDDDEALTHKNMIASACTGVVNAVICKPFEYIKISVQTRPVPGEAYMACFARNMKQHGLRCFYRGISGSMVRDGFGNIGFFAGYTIAKSKFTKLYAQIQGKYNRVSINDEIKVVPIVFAGALAGIVYELMSYPFETATVLMTLDATVMRPRYKSLIQTMGLVFHERGIPGLYEGITPTIIRALPAYSASLFGYELALRMFNHTGDLDDS
jgi:hypothetical protein